MASEGGNSHLMTFHSSNHASGILREFQRLREAGTMCDVTLHVGGQKIPAHKLVLIATSHFFAGMFSSGMQESRSGIIELNNIDSIAVKSLLDFAYTAQISFSYSSAQQLIVASDMLQFLDVKQACCDYLQSSLDSTNCFELLQFADKHSCIDFHRAAQLHCNIHFNTVSSQPEFLELPLDQLEVYLCSDHLRVEGERCVLEAAFHWLDHNITSESHHMLYRVLCCVRLSLLPPDVLLDRVWNHKLVSSSSECMELLRRALSVHISSTHTTPPLEQHRRPFQVMCAIGGWDGKSVVSTVEWYDPDINQWKLGAPLNQPRKRLSVVSHDGKVYAIGGHDGMKTLCSVELYDQNTKCWTTIPSMMQARMFAACVVLNGKVYAIGGQCKLGVLLDTAEVFDPTLNHWQFIASMGTKLGSPVAVAYNNTIHILGKGSNNTYNLHTYNPSHDTWTQIQTTLPYHMYVEAVDCAGTIYILCGSSSSRQVGVWFMYCYHPDTPHQWSTVDCQIPSPRAGFAAVVANDVILVVGGHRGREKLSSVDLYDPVKGAWQTLGDMSQSRCVLGAVAVEQLTLL